MGSCLEKMHSVGGRSHLDIKPSNALVNENGKAVLSDFGNSVPTGIVSHSQILVPSSPYFTAPELYKMAKDGAQAFAREENKVQLDKEGFAAKYKEIFNPEESSTKEIINNNIDYIFSGKMDDIKVRSRTEVQNRSGIGANTEKADVWSFGASVYKALTGNLLGSELNTVATDNKQVGSGSKDTAEIFMKFHEEGVKPGSVKIKT